MNSTTLLLSLLTQGCPTDYTAQGFAFILSTFEKDCKSLIAFILLSNYSVNSLEDYKSAAIKYYFTEDSPTYIDPIYKERYPEYFI